MPAITKLKLYLLRGMYLFISLGLVITIWPEILYPNLRLANQDSVIQSLLGALALIAAIGIRYPLKMLPVLFFELLWKLIWVLGFALPTYKNTGLDTYAKETFFACLIGIVLVPFTIPWRYVQSQYIKSKTK
ncbi:hypothetical protein KO566_05940 [Flavobacteriaceae bacterium XHP0103]|uniref:hypothetical protein n=1 Tax=Marixanthotalea marina TaxID=2844359 RepID=UPI002989E214|nr:hypothetical protein [Marixanthotalea marina]MBU3821592.1 hypothetical protein [Marixanthotalea marina]